MDRARRGYILIAVLAALALCTALLGAYAATARRAVTLAAADVQGAQAQYAARGAAIQAAKDLSYGIGRGGFALQAGRFGASGEGSGGAPRGASTQIEGLPAFPPEMSNAAGFLGILARRMEQARSSQGVEPARAEPEPAGQSGAEDGAAGVEAAPPAPIVVTGRGYMEFDGARVEVSLESENGKINLNLSTRRTLRDLLIVLGAQSDEADATLNAIEDHRLSLLAATSVERAAGSRREMERPLRGRPLDRIEDLLNVPGLSPALYESLVRHATVMGEGLLDPNYASEEALIAVGIHSEPLLRRIAEVKSRREPLTATSMRQILGMAVYNQVADRLAYSLEPLFTVRARATKGASVGRFMMRITINENGTPVMLESREGWM